MTDSRPRAAQPNYAARRMLVSAGAITAIVVAASGVWQLARGDDPQVTAAPVNWDAIAFVATSTGDVTLLDPGGAVVARLDGTGRVTSVHSAATDLALVHADRVTLLDTAAGASTQPDEVALPAGSRTVTRLATTRDHLLLAAGNRTGGAIRLIDAETGGSYDLAALAGLADPLLYTGTLRVDPPGSTVAVADAATGQTIVVSGIGAPTGDAALDEPAVENYADQPLAVTAELLATTQVVGGRADVSVHRLGTAASAPVATGIPAGGALLGGRLLAVTTDGQVVAIRVGDRQPRQLAMLTLPPDATVTAVYLAANGTRLVVYAEGYVGVLDQNGAVIVETEVGGTASATTAPATDGVTGPATSPPASTPAAAPTTGPAVGSTVGSTVAGSTTSSSTGVPGGTTPVTAPPADAPIKLAEPLAPAWEWTCLAIGLGTPSASLIDLADGSPLAELGGIAVTDTSADGCVVLGAVGTTTAVAGAAGRADLGPSRSATLSPDATVVVRRTDDRVTEVIPLADDLQPGTAIDVTTVVPSAAYAVAFVER